VKELRVMDAAALDFPDASFDCVVAQFVITLVNDPERVLDECARVLWCDSAAARRWPSRPDVSPNG
jgi:ubiquinone/menaquinone biosynthesis C-methylase UbiE